MRVSASKWFFDQCMSISQGQLSDHRGSSGVQSFHLPFMCGVSKSKSMFQASLKNGLLLLVVPLGCYLAGSTRWRFEKNILLANRGWTALLWSSGLLCSCLRISVAEEQQNPVSLQFCKKHGETMNTVQWIQSIEESWLLQSNFFFLFAGTLAHMSCCRYSQRKMREGTMRGFCWTQIIVLPSWTWHLTQYLIPVQSIL